MHTHLLPSPTLCTDLAVTAFIQTFRSSCFHLDGSSLKKYIKMHTVSSIYVWGSAPSTAAAPQNRSAVLLLESVLIVSRGTHLVVTFTSSHFDKQEICACFFRNRSADAELLPYHIPMGYKDYVDRDTFLGCSWLRIHCCKGDETIKDKIERRWVIGSVARGGPR